MSRRVLTALAHDVESGVVRSAEDHPDLTVVRRCADLADLLAAAAAGVADVALVSAGTRGLDRAALAQLGECGVAVVGVTRLGDEGEERRLRQLGVDVVARSDLAAEDWSPLIEQLRGAQTRSGELGRAGGPPDRDGGAPAWGGNGGTRAADGSDRADTSADTSADASADPSADASPDAERLPGRIVAVWGPLGSPGVTTIAVNVAAELADRGASVLLIDADTWGASIAQSLAVVDEAPGIAAAVRAADQGTLDRVTLARLAPQVRPGLRVLTGLPRPDRWPELRAAAVEEVLRLARTIADVIVVDCAFALEDDEELSYDTVAPRRNAVTLLVLQVADDLVAVGSAEPVGLQRLVRGIQDLAVIQAPPPRVVVNKVRASAVGSHPERTIGDALARFSGVRDVTYLPWDPQTCDAAMLAGEVLAQTAPRSPLRKAIATLSRAWSAAYASTAG